MRHKSNSGQMKNGKQAFHVIWQYNHIVGQIAPYQPPRDQTAIDQFRIPTVDFCNVTWCEAFTFTTLIQLGSFFSQLPTQIEHFTNSWRASSNLDCWAWVGLVFSLVLDAKWQFGLHIQGPSQQSIRHLTNTLCAAAAVRDIYRN